MPTNCTDIQNAIDTLVQNADNCTTPGQLGSLVGNTFQVVKNYQCENLPETFCIQELGTHDPGAMPAPASSDLVCFGRDPSERYWLNIDPTGADPSRAWIPIGVNIRDLGASITSPADDPDYDYEVGQTTAGTYYVNINKSGWRRADHSPQKGAYQVKWDGGNWDYTKQYLVGLTMASSFDTQMTGFDDGHYIFEARFPLAWIFDSQGELDAIYIRIQKNGTDFVTQQVRTYSYPSVSTDENLGLIAECYGEVDLVEADNVKIVMDDGATNDLPYDDYHFLHDSDRLGFIKFERTGD